MSPPQRSQWERQGLLCTLQPNAWWSSHAQTPTVLVLSAKLWRIYFAGRNAQNQSAVLALDVDPTNNMRCVKQHFTPLFKASVAGNFDSSGVGPSCALHVRKQVFLYYTGIFQRRDVPYQMAIGLAVSDDGLVFRRVFDGPILGVGRNDPHFTSTPCVRLIKNGFQMWYVSGTSWDLIKGQQEPSYNIRTSVSADGINWSADSQLVSLPQGSDVALTRPWVLDTQEGLRMWYARRGHDFREAGPAAYSFASCALDAKGFATLPHDPVAFTSPPEIGAFDESMQAYGCVMPWKDTQVLFYNGNEFGQTGIGWAVKQRRQPS